LSLDSYFFTCLLFVLEGDVGAIYSDCSKAKELFGWSTKRDILDMMRTSWEWQKKITS
jgi:UDP-glucose 4-epimerase